MARFNFYQKKKEDKIVYGDGIVDGIILLAVSELPNVELFTSKSSNKKKNNSIKVDLSKDGLEIDVYVKIHYSLSVSDIAFKIQETIRHNIESMTDYHIKFVNVNVVGVFFEEKKGNPTNTATPNETKPTGDNTINGTKETTTENKTTDK